MSLLRWVKHLSLGILLTITVTSSGADLAPPFNSSDPAVALQIAPPADAERISTAGVPSRSSPKRLEIPAGLPGHDAVTLQLPEWDPKMSDAQRSAAVAKVYRSLPDLPAVAPPTPHATEKPLALVDLQQLAFDNSPLIRQAEADILAARGTALQAGVIPNPHVGFQADNVNTGHTPGYQGIAFSQTVPTGGKLELARAAACIDVQNAEQALRKSRGDLAIQIRGGYYNVLIAREKVKVTRALDEFALNAYRLQVERVKGGQAVPYEPLQLRVLAVQARAQVMQALNEEINSWRQLVSAMGIPDLPPADLIGRIELPGPPLRYDAAVQHLLYNHTDLIIARNSVAKSRYQLQLAKRTPWVPDLDVAAVVEKDYTLGLNNTTYNLQVSAPIPVFDRNSGNILNAQGVLQRSCHEYDRVRNDLCAQLSDACSRYQTSRVLLEYYRDGMIADQVRTYRAMYDRHEQEPTAVDFSDLFVAQQALAGLITSYLQALSDYWRAAVDVARIAQIDELEHLAGEEEAAPPLSGQLEQLPDAPFPPAAPK